MLPRERGAKFLEIRDLATQHSQAFRVPGSKIYAF
jgi:hypothetical protein